MKVPLGPDDVRKLPIVIISMSRWDSPISSASWSLAKEFGKHNRVYYVDYPYTFSEWFRGRKLPAIQMRRRALLRGNSQVRTIYEYTDGIVKAITPTLVFPVNWLRKGWGYNLLSDINDRILAKAIRKTLGEENVGQYLFLNSFNPTYLANYKKYLNPILAIYQSRDAIGAINAYTRKHGAYREIQAIRSYDMAIATSQNLSKDLTQSSGKTVSIFPNGGDTELFKSTWQTAGEIPDELAHIRTPIIGYTGNICQRIDYVLLKKIAEAHPDKTLVLVGPREDKIYTDINLDRIPNLLFTGPRKLEELPRYLRYFDCAIIPFLINEFTRSIYPLKINEYLAAGRAVVTTDFSPDIIDFSEHIYLATDHRKFLKLIDRAIESNSSSVCRERYDVAKSNSWENRVRDFWGMASKCYAALKL
ncbi:glycosyltransferase [Algoriphagus sp. Y33]|uniref:glycosyltransferase n=1 Tax=Algoriphagus sp. Y33 TaxID=2772483 RepID=UPI0017820147|nr:glycosyltransferase [Algoriphagus sp. Y33]